jgi:glycosyltransferase involved in cell wall biosynthesis
MIPSHATKKSIQMTQPILRLAIVSDAVAPWSVGGRESLLSELLPQLAKVGVDITVYTMRWWEESPPDEKVGEGYIRFRAICKLRPLYKNGRRSFVQAIYFSFGSLRLIFGNFDIIQSDPVPYFHLLSVWLASKIRRRPLVIVWHEVWGKSYWRRYLGPLGIFGYLIERVSSHVGDVRLAVSRHTYRHLAEYGTRHQHPILTESAAREISGVFEINSPELVFVGRLVSHKRPDLAVRILEELVDLPIRLCIVGSGPMKSDLETQVHAAHLTDRVSFIDLATEKVLGDLLRSARVLLSPSECEGFGLVVAEALSLGTPVVTVDAPTNAAQELVINNVTGRICRAGDAKELASAVRELISVPLRLNNVKEGWESLGVPRTYKEVAQNYLAVYQNLIDEHRDGRNRE